MIHVEQIDMNDTRVFPIRKRENFFPMDEEKHETDKKMKRCVFGVTVRFRLSVNIRRRLFYSCIRQQKTHFFPIKAKNTHNNSDFLRLPFVDKTMTFERTQKG